MNSPQGNLIRDRAAGTRLGWGEEAASDGRLGFKAKPLPVLGWGITNVELQLELLECVQKTQEGSQAQWYKRGTQLQDTGSSVEIQALY